MKKLFAALLLMLAPVFALGQAISVNGGSIQGTITDPSGAAIPGATVVVANPATGYSHTLTTDGAGFYSLGPLTPGSYKVTVSASNFQRLSVNTVIRTGTATPGSFKLTVGSENETIEVNAGALQINTDQIGVSGLITSQQLDTLPVNGRNILDAASVEPGVILQSGESFDPTKAGYSALAIGGVSGRTTRILLDGQDITDETVGTTLFNVPTGAIDELQLNRSTQDVSGEVTSTGQVLLSTQSGTNRFHGNLFYNFQDYRAGFAGVNGVDAPFQRNQFGGYVGGPIFKDKLFFFGGAERIKQDAENVANPNAHFPSITDQYKYTPAPFRDTYSTARLDYNAPWGIHLFARASYSVNADDATAGYDPYSVYTNRDNVPSLVGGADFTTGKFTHSFRFGYEKFTNLIVDGTAALGNSIYNPSLQLGFSMTMVGAIYAGQNLLAPQGTYQSDKQFRYDGTWTHGAHSVKFGAEMNRILGGGYAPFYAGGLYTDLSTSAAHQLAHCNNDGESAPCLDDPLHGYASAEYVLGNGNGFFTERPGFGLPGGGNYSWRFAAYLADTWKVTPSFTVEGGLRWSVDTDRANQDLPTPLCSQVDPSLQFPGCTGDTPLFDQYQAGLGHRTHQPYGNFGPQAGFVFSPGSHKLSVRGGAGIYYESDIFNNLGNARPEVITANGPYWGYGYATYTSSSMVLPGYATVTGLMDDGTPCDPDSGEGCKALSDVFAEPIAQSAATFNGLKTLYDSAVEGKNAPNGSYIGTGNVLIADNIYPGPYLSPYSIQFNGGVQYEIAKGLIVSADYIHNATLKLSESIDVNHIGAARFFNKTAAQNAIAATTSSFDCDGGYSAAAIDCAIDQGAVIDDFAGNGLDSGNDYLGGAPASAYGVTADYGSAFPGQNTNVGNGLFILPIGKSGYDAFQLVVQQQKAHPAPGIISSNFQISYNLARAITTTGEGAGEGSSDPFFASGSPYDYDDVNAYMGRNNLDRSNQLSLGGSLGIKYGLQVGFVGHFYSALPSTLTLPTSTGSGQIFKSDVNGDGQERDLVPGTLPGDYMHRFKGKGLNHLIDTYNSTDAGQLTPAGQTLVSSGLFSQGQLVALNAVQQPLAPVPTTPLNNPSRRAFDLSASYPIHLNKVREGLSIVPGIAMYNVFNFSNFGSFDTLVTAADGGTSAANGALNGPNSQDILNTERVQRGSGTYDAGGPRTTEFQLKVNF